MRVSLPASHADAPPTWAGQLLSPEIGAAAAQFSQVTYTHSKLSLREFEAARVMTAEINGCVICRNWRSAVDLPLHLKSLGVEDPSALLSQGPAPDDAFYTGIREWRSSDRYSARERIAIELAERMGIEPQSVSRDDDFWQRAKAVFSDAELVDLGYCIACWMGLGRFTHVFGMDSVCALPSVRAA